MLNTGKEERIGVACRIPGKIREFEWHIKYH